MKGMVYIETKRNTRIYQRPNGSISSSVATTEDRDLVNQGLFANDLSAALVRLYPDRNWHVNCGHEGHHEDLLWPIGGGGQAAVFFSGDDAHVLRVIR